MYVSRFLVLEFEIMNLFPDGDMEAAGVAVWLVANSAIVTKETASPQAGLQNLKVAYGGAGYPSVYQNILEIGHTYHLTGYGRRGGCNFSIGNSATILWTCSPLGENWQYFDVTFIPISGNINLLVYADSPGQYAEFDTFELYDMTAAGQLQLFAQ